jgi:hypothetical protein
MPTADILLGKKETGSLSFSSDNVGNLHRCN